MKKNATDFKVKNQRVIIRCDLNVPIKDGVITDDTRIKASVETIEHLDYAKMIKEEFGMEIMFEMGLQTANDNSLKILNRAIKKNTILSFFIRYKIFYFPKQN